MPKIRMEIELTVSDETMGVGPDEIQWFRDVILMDQDPDGLILHSNELGDEVGSVRVLSIHQ